MNDDDEAKAVALQCEEASVPAVMMFGNHRDIATGKGLCTGVAPAISLIHISFICQGLWSEGARTQESIRA
jgi:hypothetical protein